MTLKELQTSIWPADSFVDLDHDPHKAIARIREVLGDSADIETLPRRGYQYIGPMEYFQTVRLATDMDEHTTQPVRRSFNPYRGVP